MGTIHDAGFGQAMTTGLQNLNAEEMEIFDTDGSSTNTANANPKTTVDWNIYDGHYIGETGNLWAQWEKAGSDASIGKMVVSVQGLSTQTKKPFLTFDEGNDSTGPLAGVGAAIKVEFIPASNTDGPVGLLNLVRDGVAQTMLNGVGPTIFDAVLFDGSGTELDRINDVSVTYDVGNDKLQTNNDLTFQNGSGGQWSVEEFQLKEQNTGQFFTIDQTISETVQDGGSITFTAVETAVNF